MSAEEHGKLVELLINLDNKLDEKIDDVKDHLSEIDVKLADYNAQLGNHIKRTELLEKRVDPIEESYNTWKALKFWTVLIGGTLSGIVAFVYLVQQILTSWKH